MMPARPTARRSTPVAAASCGPAATERTSEILVRVLSAGTGPRIALDTVITALGDRAFGLVLLILALPNCMPTPPGLGAVTGLVIMFFAAQMVIGRHHPWLPPLLKRQEFDRATMLRVLARATPYIHRFEALSKPRWLFATSHGAERVVGLLLMMLGIVVSLPIPLTNMPTGLALALVAIGFAERDGIAVAIGLLLGVGATAFTASIAGAFFAGSGALIERLFG